MCWRLPYFSSSSTRSSKGLGPHTSAVDPVGPCLEGKVPSILLYFPRPIKFMVKSAAAGNDDRPPPYQARDREPSPVDQEDAAFASYDPPGGACILLFPLPCPPVLPKLLRKLTQADKYANCALCEAAGASHAGSVSPVSYGSLYSIERLLAAGENLALVVAVDPDDARRARKWNACSLVAARVTLRGASASASHARVHASVHGCLHAHGTCTRIHTCCLASRKLGCSFRTRFISLFCPSAGILMCIPTPACPLHTFMPSCINKNCICVGVRVREYTYPLSRTLCHARALWLAVLLASSGSNVLSRWLALAAGKKPEKFHL